MNTESLYKISGATAKINRPQLAELERKQQNAPDNSPRSKPRGTAVKDLSPGEQLTRSARHQDGKKNNDQRGNGEDQRLRYPRK